MHERPAGIADGELTAVLRESWRLDPAELVYLPVGFGGYHWLARDLAGARWFVTVTDATQPWAGDLSATMSTAAWLAHEARLRFVVAPVATTSGSVVAALHGSYAVTLFPYCDGDTGGEGPWATSGDRLAVTDLLADLHGVRPEQVPAPVPIRRPELACRAAADTALADLGGPWYGGPFAEPGRAVLSQYAGALRMALARFDDLVARIAGAGTPLVITHGEPKPSNFLRSRSGLLLVDWDTLGLAVPERDLWWVGTGASAEAARYKARTGRDVSPDGLALYRLRWSLDDITLFLAEIRAPHEETADTRVSWNGLRTTLEALGKRMKTQ